MARRRTIALLLAALAAAFAPRVTPAEEVPARHHALLLLRVLAYDRNIQQRAGSPLTVVVLSRPGDRGSEHRSKELRTAFEEVANKVVVAGLSVQVKELPFHGADDLESRLAAIHPVLVEVDEALESALPDVLRTTRPRGISTSGTRDMAQGGATFGVSVNAGRASLTVNLSGARAEGADLDAALLDICEVIRK